MKTRTPKREARKEDKYPRLSVRINKELRARIETTGAAIDRSHGWIVTQALQKYLPELEKSHGLTK